VNKRNFPDFITAYYNYARDKFCPDKFHFWTGISLIAGALERKVFLRQGKWNFYPNLYIMLVAHPGIGKSAAINTGVNNILSQVEGINYIPQHVSEAMLVEMLGRQKVFYVGNREIPHSSSFWVISEASNVLSEKTGGGDLIPLITDIYDCPDTWAKGTKKDGVDDYTNMCLNMLSGITFNFAQELILGQNSAGGFASRNIYVVHDTTMVRYPTWESPLDNKEYRNQLVEDLIQINTMSGQFKLSPEFKEAYLEWFPINDKRNQTLKNITLKHFMARNHTNILKLAQIMSASESNELLITLDHWNKAKDIIGNINKQLPGLISQGGGIIYGIGGMKQMIVNKLREQKFGLQNLRRALPYDTDMRFFMDAIDDLGKSKIIDQNIIEGKALFYLLNDPQDKL